MASNASRLFNQVLEAVFSRLSGGEKIVVVEVNWVRDYQRCARHFIDTSDGMYTSYTVLIKFHSFNNNNTTIYKAP